ENGIKTIAFPNISTGIYKFPKELAAKVALKAIREFEKSQELEEVIIICFEEDNYRIYQELMK
ncbi:MAG: macro domain-containing protein, partial [Flavobacteriaceae bacterium]|nr:macro domain-containing protein [Flavobacteriaceae bacterium]